jgi:molecular chaperone GrpE
MNNEQIENQDVENQSQNSETTITENEEIQSELSLEEKLKAELAEQKDKFLRLYSEFENFRKRTAKERIDLISTAGESLIVSILPIVDDLERAQKSMQTSTDIDAVKEGVKLISDKFVKILEGKGLTAIETENQEFNTELHEAITQIPAPSEDMKGKIVDCVEKGYKLGEKVVRYSKVVIGF